MFGIGEKKDKQKKIDDKVTNLNKPIDGSTLSKSLKSNISLLKNLFADNDTLILRNINNSYNSELKYCVAYCDGGVSSEIINESLIKPLILSKEIEPGTDLIKTIEKQVIFINESKKTKEIKDIITSITYGDTILFAEGSDEALILNTKGFTLRSVTEPESEKTLSGPREGFCESLMINLSLIRRRLRTNDLKMKFKSIGTRTNTTACICYLDSIVNKNILNEIERRLEKIDIDGILDSNYIAELIRDARFSMFRTIGYTERPDVIAAKLLEGRVAIIVDGTPTTITMPYLFIENFQSNEDYYLSFFYTSFARVLRIVGFFLTIAIPAIYIAAGDFNIEMIPTSLLINIASERQSVPLPAALECFIMLITFDILRETGIRMPSKVGQALSIVGALVIGQAAVEAKMVAAPMIIVVALTGITNLLVPKLNAPIIYIRLGLLFLASSFGFFGLLIGLACILIHLLNLYSLGVPMISASGNLQYQEVKDIAIRAPWWQMIKRPNKLTKDEIRMKAPDKNKSEE